MRAVAFNGSSRKSGNTFTMLQQLCEELHKADVETEIVQLAHEYPLGCMACYQCFKQKNGLCAIDTDCVNGCIKKMLDADAIILASPTYFSNNPTRMQALMERVSMTSHANGDMLKRKLGAAVVVQKRGEGMHAFNSMNHFFATMQMVIAGSSCWNIGEWMDGEDASTNQEGMVTMRELGQNMAWLLKKMYS